MDELAVFKTAAAEELPDAVEVRDRFHAVKLASDAFNETRRRIHQETPGHCGQAMDPLHRARRMLHTGTTLLTTTQHRRVARLFADTNFTEVEVTWSVYQDIITAYQSEDRRNDKWLKWRLPAVIDTFASGLCAGLPELKRWGRTPNRCETDMLEFFSGRGTSNEPTEAVNGRLGHLWRSAPGFRNLAHYIARCFLESDGFKPVLHGHLP